MICPKLEIANFDGSGIWEEHIIKYVEDNTNNVNLLEIKENIDKVLANYNKELKNTCSLYRRILQVEDNNNN